MDAATDDWEGLAKRMRKSQQMIGKGPSGDPTRTAAAPLEIAFQTTGVTRAVRWSKTGSPKDNVRGTGQITVNRHVSPTNTGHGAVDVAAFGSAHSSLLSSYPVPGNDVSLRR